MLPHDIEAEEAVLAALLVSEEQVYALAGKLTPGEFYRPENAAIFAACMSVYGAGQGVNLVTVAHELANKSKLDFVGGQAEMARMISMLPTAEGAPFYANIVRETATRRHLIEMGHKIQQLASDEMPVEDVVGKAEAYLHRLRQKRVMVTTSTGGTAEEWAATEDFLRAPGKIRGLRTGWEKLDWAMNGLVSGRLITAGAATSVGKSGFVGNVVRQLSIQRIPSLVFTTEMSAREVRERLTFMHAGVDRLSLRQRGYTRDEEREAVEMAIGDVRGWPVWYCEESHPTPAAMRSEVRRAKELHGIQAVFVDHLGYVEGRGESERERITDAVASLKGIAQDEDLPVVATSHVNRAGAGSGEWLKLTDLHGASAIEKDSDQVLLMTPCRWNTSIGDWSPLTADETREAKRDGLFTISFEIAKNRHGGWAQEFMLLDWHNQGGRFEPAA